MRSGFRNTTNNYENLGQHFPGSGTSTGPITGSYAPLSLWGTYNRLSIVPKCPNDRNVHLTTNFIISPQTLPFTNLKLGFPAFFGLLTLERGTDQLSRKFAKKLPQLGA